MTKISIFIIIISILAAGIVVLATEVSVQRQEIKNLLGRREKKDKPKPVQQAENGCRNCIHNFHYENIVIPELHLEIEYWKRAFRKEQKCNALMHSEIAKLRTNKEDDDDE